PVFVDINEKTLNIDTPKIEEKITAKTKAILAVDVFGRPADWLGLTKIAKKHGLFLIEDSAEAVGSEYYGRRCGSFGDAAVYSFYPNKQITTGEGGVILTNNQDLADLCRSMVNQGRKISGENWLEHIRLGYNYRLDEMSAALGISQLSRIKEIIKNREKVVKLYNKKLKGINFIVTPEFEQEKKISWFVYVVKLFGRVAERRNEVIAKMAERGIQCSNYFYPICLQPFYKEKFHYIDGSFPITEAVGKRTLALPFYNSLKESEIDFVVKNLKEVIKELNV
ncbi:DegT/DnrJ/EryC1/StrS family aminotransferase, partial [Patescibacteria group bacterium]|nr:DegT/DnrJ/EryC1/StrS family aminotransferase [Patescibacteria group bacterium]